MIKKNDSRINLPFPYCCINLVLAPTIDTSGETLSAQEGDVERAGVLRVLLVTIKLNLGCYNPCTDKEKPTNGFVARTENLRLRECFGGQLRKKSLTGWNEKNDTSRNKRT